MAEIAKAWIFQYDQTRYEIEEFMREHGEYDWWEVTRLGDEMSVGDRVYFRRSNTKGPLSTGISAVGRLLSPVYNPDPPTITRRVDLHYEWQVEPTLTVAEVKDEPLLGAKGALVPGVSGTNFALTPAEAARLDELVTPRLQPFPPHAQVIDPLLEFDERTRTLAAVVQRQGQPEFRNRLIEVYGGRCAITGCDAIDALEAAHIRPYLGPKTNHVSNGLLLRADIHTLFDKRLLAIDAERMTVVLHPSLKGTTYRDLEDKPIHLPSNSDQRPNKEAVRYHQERSSL